MAKLRPTEFISITLTSEPFMNHQDIADYIEAQQMPCAPKFAFFFGEGKNGTYHITQYESDKCIIMFCGGWTSKSHDTMPDLPDGGRVCLECSSKQRRAMNGE